MGRQLRLSALAAATSLLATAGASAAPSASAPPPRLSDLVVGVPDLGAGTVALGDRTTKLDRTRALFRALETTSGGKRVIVVVVATVERNADAAYADFAESRTELGLAGVRKNLTQSMQPAFGLGAQLIGGTGALKGITVKRAVIGRRVALGESAFWVPLTMVLNKGTIH